MHPQICFSIKRSLMLPSMLTCLIVLVACNNIQPSPLPIATPLGSDKPAVGSLQISDVWIRSAQRPATISGAYMTITNTGSSADTLMSVQGVVATAIELHTMGETNGVMQMRPAQGIEIPANDTLQLKPGSQHVMLIGLTQELKAGDRVTLTLNFKIAGTIHVIATVRNS